MVQEYIGSDYAKIGISFVEPSVLGMDPAALGDSVAVCARVGSIELPVDIGWLVHYIRPTAGGSEMRSRFWKGGPMWRCAAATASPIAPSGLFVTRQLPDPRDLMVHCAGDEPPGGVSARTSCAVCQPLIEGKLPGVKSAPEQRRARLPIPRECALMRAMFLSED